MIHLTFSRTFISTLSVFCLALFFFAQLLLPLSAQAVSSGSNSVVSLNVATGISITGGGNDTLSQTLGVGANSATGTTTLTVITNDASGYTLTLSSTSTPAMINTSSSTLNIANYTISTPSTWSITSGTAAFGYSAYGTDVNTGTWGTQSGTTCQGASSVNATSTTLKYRGFSTTTFAVVSTANTTLPSGDATNVCYAVEQKNYFIPVVGGGTNTYQATVVATATTN